MVNDINLLPRKNKAFFSEEGILFFLRVAAVTSIILVLSTSIVFFLLSRSETGQQIKVDQSNTLAKLALLQNKTAKYLVIVDRLSKIASLTRQTSNLDSTISLLTQQIPLGISITAFTLDAKTVSFSLSSKDLTLLGTAITNLSALVENKKVLKLVTIQSLISDERGGVYVLTISGTLL